MATEGPQNGYSEREQRHYREITTLNSEVVDAQIVFSRDNEEAKASRKIYETLAIKLQQLITAGPDPQGILPGIDDERPDPQERLPGIDDSWQDTAIGVALEELTDKQLDFLAAADIRTMGELEQKRAGEGLTSVAGIGEDCRENRGTDHQLAGKAADLT